MRRFITSRGHVCAVERAAAHFSGNALDCASANLALPGNRQHALACPQLTLDSFFQGGVLFARLHGSPKPGADTLADHAALKRGKGAGDLKQPNGTVLTLSWLGRSTGSAAR
ncbi:MAG TPA: hypothetical protein VGP68_10210 [Gemmataceae bacterium]|nr:hypothetical protein [Gemmataceae bacterium]